MKSLRLTKSDEVIVPAFTYISTGLSVALNNNKLVCADVDIDTGLISIDKIHKYINKNTRAIIPVNLYGQKVDLRRLRKKISKKIFVIEDSAQSHFAYSCYNCVNRNMNKCCKKEKNDRYADISCFSFYPSKNIGAYGDGGLVATNKANLYKNLRKLRNLGSIKKNEHNLLGMNSRLDTIQAVILNRKLKSILKMNDLRRKIAFFYDEKLSKIKQIKLTKTKPGSVRHLYVIKTKRRNLLIKYLLKRDISCQIHYPYIINELKFFSKIAKKKDKLLNSKRWIKECLSLPIHPKQKLSESLRVVKEIKKFFAN